MATNLSEELMPLFKKALTILNVGGEFSGEPTQEEVLRWFRNNNYHVCVQYSYNESLNCRGYDGYIQKVDNGGRPLRVFDEDLFGVTKKSLIVYRHYPKYSYEQAMDAIIEEALKHIIINDAK